MAFKKGSSKHKSKRKRALDLEDRVIKERKLRAKKAMEETRVEAIQHGRALKQNARRAKYLSESEARLTASESSAVKLCHKDPLLDYVFSLKLLPDELERLYKANREGAKRQNNCVTDLRDVQYEGIVDDGSESMASAFYKTNEFSELSTGSLKAGSSNQFRISKNYLLEVTESGNEEFRSMCPSGFFGGLDSPLTVFERSLMSMKSVQVELVERHLDKSRSYIDRVATHVKSYLSDMAISEISGKPLRLGGPNSCAVLVMTPFAYSAYYFMRLLVDSCDIAANSSCEKFLTKSDEVLESTQYFNPTSVTKSAATKEGAVSWRDVIYDGDTEVEDYGSVLLGLMEPEDLDETDNGPSLLAKCRVVHVKSVADAERCLVIAGTPVAVQSLITDKTSTGETRKKSNSVSDKKRSAQNESIVESELNDDEIDGEKISPVPSTQSLGFTSSLEIYVEIHPDVCEQVSRASIDLVRTNLCCIPLLATRDIDSVRPAFASEDREVPRRYLQVISISASPVNLETDLLLKKNFRGHASIVQVPDVKSLSGLSASQDVGSASKLASRFVLLDGMLSSDEFYERLVTQFEHGSDGGMGKFAKIRCASYFHDSTDESAESASGLERCALVIVPNRSTAEDLRSILVEHDNAEQFLDEDLVHFRRDAAAKLALKSLREKSIPFIVTTERMLFYRRCNLRGITDVIYFGAPVFLPVFKEVLSQSDGMITVVNLKAEIGQLSTGGETVSSPSYQDASLLSRCCYSVFGPSLNRLAVSL